MIQTIRTEIPNWRLIELDMRTQYDILEKFNDLIFKGEVLHNDQLNIDFVVLEARVCENFEKCAKEVEVIIDILDDSNRNTYESLRVLKDHLGRLLPTKRPENKVAEE